jgi:hypothetical protein
MWQNNDVSEVSHTAKDVRHPTLGKISFEASTFGVDGRHDLTMMMFMPASEEIAERIMRLLAKQDERIRPSFGKAAKV